MGISHSRSTELLDSESEVSGLHTMHPKSTDSAGIKAGGRPTYVPSYIEKDKDKVRVRFQTVRFESMTVRP